MDSPKDEKPLVARDVARLRDQVRDWRHSGRTIGLVPTMGALHAGHLSLIDIAARHSERVIVSIFVNPTQFAPGEDFDNYPRRVAEDLSILAQKPVDLAYIPSTEQMYPNGFSTRVTVPELSNDLCGKFRSGHFEGVTTIVSKLFIQCRPDKAFFGEKDYQQLLIIKQMCNDLDFPVEIIGGPIVRESDGLALSSRNVYLSAAQRQIATRLPQTLFALAERLSDKPADIGEQLKWGKEQLEAAGFDQIDYLELRDAASLEPIGDLTAPGRLLAAVRIGKTRLIDNIAVPAVK